MDELAEAVFMSYRRWLRGELIGHHDGELFEIYAAARKAHPKEMERIRKDVFRRIPR